VRLISVRAVGVFCLISTSCMGREFVTFIVVKLARVRRAEQLLRGQLSSRPPCHVPFCGCTQPAMLTINWGPWGEWRHPAQKHTPKQSRRETAPSAIPPTALAHLGQALSAFESSQASGRQFLITNVYWSRSPWASSTVIPQCQTQSAPSQSVKSLSPGIRSDV
jgi:hypothetical protein